MQLGQSTAFELSTALRSRRHFLYSLAQGRIEHNEETAFAQWGRRDHLNVSHGGRIPLCTALLNGQFEQGIHCVESHLRRRKRKFAVASVRQSVRQGVG